MRDASRKNKILVGGYRVFLFPDPIPTGAVYAIDKYILVDRFFPFPEVMFGFRIITNVSDVQHRGQRIFFHPVDDHTGKHQSSFSGKSIF